MVYQWKFPQLYSVDPQVAGESLEAIRKRHNGLTPEAVVEDSRSEDAPLHSIFEWDDTEAANRYRISQASQLIRSITIQVEQVVDDTPTPVTIRGYHHVQGDYKPLSVVVESKDMMDELMEKAMRDLSAFERKYSTLKDLAPVFEAIEIVKKKCA